MEMKDLFEYFLIAILPFQIIGLIVYAGLRLCGSNKARRAGIVTPPLTLLVLGIALLAVFQLFLGLDGEEILYVLVIPTTLNLACAFLLQSCLGLVGDRKESFINALNLSNEDPSS